MEKINHILNLWIKNNHLSNNSVRAYELELARFSAWVSLNNYELSMIDSQLMEKYLTSLKFDPEDDRSQFYIRRKKGLSDSSVEQSRRVLHAFFEWALRNDHVSKNPFWTSNEFQLEKIKSYPQILTPKLPVKIKKILSTRGGDLRDEAALRVATIAHLAFWVGASRQEIAQLKKCNFTYDHSTSYIALPIFKNQKMMNVLLPKHSAVIIKKYLESRGELDVNAPLVCSIKTGGFMTGWSVRHTLRKWQKDQAPPQSASVIIGPRQLRQAFQGLAIRNEVPERIIGAHFRVKQLQSPIEKIPDGYTKSLYKAVSMAM